MKLVPNEQSAEQAPDMTEIAKLPDDQIDTSDIPEVLDWSDARRGVFYRPIKKQITIRIDADVIDWFKNQTHGRRGYQTDINRVLREHVLRGHSRASLAESVQSKSDSNPLWNSSDK